MYAGLLLPFNGLELTKKKKKISVNEEILKESLKQSKEIMNSTNHLI